MRIIMTLCARFHNKFTKARHIIDEARASRWIEKHEASHFNEKQKQTKLGEDNAEQDKLENQEFTGPKEDKKTQRD
eukprot:13548486-Heterocapsa_arctica.AAC.1